MPDYKEILAALGMNAAGSGDPDVAVAQSMLPPDPAAPPPDAPTDQGVQQFDSQGNQYTPPPPEPAPEVQPDPVLAQYDSQGNTIGQGSGGLPAVGENPDGTLMTNAPAPPPEAPAAPASPAQPPTTLVPVSGPPMAPVPARKASVPVTGGGGGDSVAKEIAAAESQNKFSQWDQAKVAGDIADAQQPYAQARADAEAADAAKQQQFIQEAHDKGGQAFDEAHAKALQYANAKIDPNQWMDSRTGFQKVMAGISMVLGAGQAGIHGGANQSPVAGAINQNIEQQKEAIERTGKSVGMLGTLATQYSSAGLDQAHAEQAAVATMQLQGAEQSQALALKFGGAAAAAKVGENLAAMKLNAQKTLATIREQHASAFAQSVHAKVEQQQLAQQQAQMNALKGLGQGAGGISPYQESLLNKSELGVVRDGTGKVLGVSTKANAEEANKALPSLDNAVSAIKAFQTERAKGGGTILPSAHSKILKATHGAAMDALDKLSASTRLGDEQVKNLKSQLGADPTAYDPLGGYDALLGQTLQRVSGERDRALARASIKPMPTIKRTDL